MIDFNLSFHLLIQNTLKIFYYDHSVKEEFTGDSSLTPPKACTTVASSIASEAFQVEISAFFL